MGFGAWGLGFGVWGLGFGVWGLGATQSGDAATENAAPSAYGEKSNMSPPKDYALDALNLKPQTLNPKP